MSDAEKQRDELLENAGARLIRKGRHHIYQFPNGRNFVTPATPSDYRGARNSLAELRRVLASHAQLAVAAPGLDRLCEVTEKTRPRVRVPNSPPREETDDPIITFGTPSSDSSQERSAKQIARPFADLRNTLKSVAEVPEFWDLDTCGRLRVLMKFIRQFAKVEALPYRHCSVSTNELEISDETVRTQLMLDRMDTVWEGRLVPCLLVHEEGFGDVLVEVEAMRTHGGLDNIIALRAEFSGGVFLHVEETPENSSQTLEEVAAQAAMDDVHAALGKMQLDPAFNAVRTQINSVMEILESKVAVSRSTSGNNHVVYNFLESEAAKKHGYHFETTESWTNPKLIRSAIRQVLQIRQDRGRNN